MSFINPAGEAYQQRIAEENNNAQAIQQAQANANEQRTTSLEALRAERLKQEAVTSLTPEARAVYEVQNNPLQLFRTVAKQAREHWDAGLAAQVEQKRLEELLSYRNKLGPGEQVRREDRDKADRHAAEFAQQLLNERAARELEAEIHTDEINRLMACMDPGEAEYFRQLWSQANSNEVVIANATKAQQFVNEDKQQELYKQFMAEALPLRGHNIAVTKLRDKYIGMGWDGSAR